MPRISSVVLLSAVTLFAGSVFQSASGNIGTVIAALIITTSFLSTDRAAAFWLILTAARSLVVPIAMPGLPAAIRSGPSASFAAATGSPVGSGILMSLKKSLTIGAIACAKRCAAVARLWMRTIINWRVCRWKENRFSAAWRLWVSQSQNTAPNRLPVCRWFWTVKDFHPASLTAVGQQSGPFTDGLQKSQAQWAEPDQACKSRKEHREKWRERVYHLTHHLG